MAMFQHIHSLPPFYTPNVRNADRTYRKRLKSGYYPIDPKKHPVTVVYEYCALQNTEPIFMFVEIPQSFGIEYGCTVVVENFVGQGRAFSKKTAKHAAAMDFIWKLNNPNYFGENEIFPKRFVSETGVISVSYDNTDTPPYRPCIKSDINGNSQSPMKKFVKWKDEFKSDIEEARKTDLPSYEADDDELIYSDDEVQKKADEPEVIEIDNYLSHELKGKASIEDKENEKLEESSSSHSEIEKRNESSASDYEITSLPYDEGVKKKKKKRSDGKKLLDFKRKVILKDKNPVGYLQEACQCYKLPIPTYLTTKENGMYTISCLIEDYKVSSTSAVLKEAKKTVASLMIDRMGW